MRVTPTALARELESGKWQKALSQLGKGDNYRCCLGVACEMAGTVVAFVDESVPSAVNVDIPWLKRTPPKWLKAQYADLVDERGFNVDHPPETVEEVLFNINDHIPGWDLVIDILYRLGGNQGRRNAQEGDK